MRRELTAWIVVGFPAIASGVIAGAQRRVTVTSLLVLSGMVAVATGIAASILPRDTDHVP